MKNSNIGMIKIIALPLDNSVSSNGGGDLILHYCYRWAGNWLKQIPEIDGYYLLPPGCLPHLRLD